MRKINYFVFAGVFILVLYTFFAIQNRIAIPVRLTFGEPGIYFLPLIVLSSFIGGAIFGSIFILIYRITLTKSGKSVCNISTYTTEPQGQDHESTTAPRWGEHPAPEDQPVLYRTTEGGSGSGFIQGQGHGPQGAEMENPNGKLERRNINDSKYKRVYQV